MIEAKLEKYSSATSKLEKSLIVSSIVDSVRDASPDGGFVKKDGGRWYEVGDHIAREKCGQSFRDLLHEKYKSSTKAKKMRRKELGKRMSSCSTFSEGSSATIGETNVAVKMEELSKATSSMGE